MKKTKLFLINSLIIICSSLVIRIITSVFDIYIANRIGAETIGIFSLISSIYLFGITFASSGINLATTKVVAEELEKNPNCNAHKIIKYSLLYSFIMGSIAAVILCLLTPLICNKFLMGKVSYSVFYILSISLPFISLSSALSGYFLAKRNAIKTSLNQVFSQLIRILAIFILLNYIFPDTMNYYILALVLGGTISEVLAFCYHMFFFLKEKTNFNITNASTSKNICKRILVIAVPIAITSYIRSGLHTLKHIIIPLRLKLSGMSYEKALADYGVITGMALPIVMFASVIVYSYSSLLITEFSSYTVNKDKTSMKKDINKLFKVTLYFSIGVTGILMCFGKELGNIFFNNQNVGWYIKILAPLITLIYLDNVIDNILKGLGKQVSVMCCNILDLIISVSFIYFLLPIFGSFGYIIVMYISEILNYTISVITLFKTTDVKFKYYDWVILPTICIISALILTSFFNLNILFKILFTILIYIFGLFINNSTCSN